MTDENDESRTTTPRERDNGWRAIVDLIVDAPPKVKWVLVVSAAGILIALALAATDVAGETGWSGVLRQVATASGLIGVMLLSVTQLLHQLSQRSAAACGRGSIFRLESKQIHRIFLALPVLALTSGLLLAGGIGLALPGALERPPLVIVIAFFAAYLVMAVRTVVHTTRFLYHYAREQAAAAARAQTEATEAQLTALQAQMNPHFLFNALNTVASLVRTDARTAEATVENLAQVLRRTLDRSHRSVTTLRDEADYLHAYLAIEQERWGDRLRVHWALDASTLDTRIPTMTLQPLVENALKHGLGGRIEGGSLTIAARRNNGRLRLSVTDDGVGFAPRHAERTGLGNLRARLATLFGTESTLRVETPRVGAEVVVEIPAHVGPGENDARSPG